MKHEIFLFEISKKGDYEMEKDVGFGTGEAFKVLNGAGSNNRRKRSTLNVNMALKSIFRAKRQTESSSEPAIANEENEKSMFQRMKDQLNHVINAAQELVKKIQQMGHGDSEAE